MIKIRIGKRIKKLREIKGWTQKNLAKKAGLHRVTIAQIEAGLRKDPPISTCIKISNALGITIAELLG